MRVVDTNVLVSGVINPGRVVGLVIGGPLYIVTGDHALLALSQVDAIRAVTPRYFVDEILK